MLQSLICLLPVLFVFLFNVKIEKKHSVFDDYLNIDSMQNLRGILAILIVLHHFSGMFTEKTLFLVFNHIGYLVVSVFFFISGYGLAYGVKNKSGYVSGVKFLYTRIPKLIIPYWVTVLIYSLVYTLLKIQTVTLKTFLLSFVSYENVVSGSWYIFELVLLYFVFFITFKLKNKKISIVLLFLIVGILSLFFYFDDNFSNLWYRSIFAFPVGVLYSYYVERIEKFYFNKTLLKYAMTIFSLIFVLVLRYICVIGGKEGPQVLFDILSSMAFPFTTIILLRKIKFSNKLLFFLGNISFEIYLIHFLIMKVFDVYYKSGEINLILYFLLTFSFSILLAWLVHFVNKFLIQKYFKIVLRKGR